MYHSHSTIIHLIPNVAPHMKLGNSTTHKDKLCFSSLMTFFSPHQLPGTYINNTQTLPPTTHTATQSDHERKQIICLTLQQHQIHSESKEILCFIVNCSTVDTQHMISMLALMIICVYLHTNYSDEVVQPSVNIITVCCYSPTCHQFCQCLLPQL